MLPSFWPTLAVGQKEADSDFDRAVQSARDALTHNDLPTAITAYRKAAAIDPHSAEISANLGVLEYDAGNYTEAATDLQRAVRQKPSLFSAQLFLGLSYLHLDRARDAVPVLSSAVRLNANDVHAHAALGRAYMTLKSWRKAAFVYRSSVAIEPKNDSAWFALGIAYLQQVEDDSQALSSIQSPSSYKEALFADSLVEQHRFVEAANLYGEAEKQLPSPPCIRAARGLAFLQLGEQTQGRNEIKEANTQGTGCNLALIGRAAVEIQDSKFEEAIQTLEELWSRDEGFTLSSLPQLIAVLTPEQVEKAKSAFTRRRDKSNFLTADALENAFNHARDNSAGTTDFPAVFQPRKQPPAIPLDMQKARMDFAEGQYAKCSADLQSATSRAAIAVLRLWSACAFLTGDYFAASESSALLRNTVAHDPEGLYWSIQANEKLAFTALDQFAMLAPDSAKTHLLLGDIDRQRQHYKEAIDEYNHSLNLDRNNYAAEQGLASAYLLDEKFPEAILAAEKALSQKPDDPEINILMAEALVGERNFEKAEPYLKKVLTGKPQFVIQAHALLGRIYFSTERDSQAFAELKLALSSDDDGSLHYLLGRLYAKHGDKGNAVVAFKQAKELSADRAHRAAIALNSDSLGDYLPK